MLESLSDALIHFYFSKIFRGLRPQTPTGAPSAALRTAAFIVAGGKAGARACVGAVTRSFQALLKPDELSRRRAESQEGRKRAESGNK